MIKVAFICVHNSCRSQIIMREANLEIEPRALSAEIIDNPTERRLRIACYLHVPRSSEYIRLAKLF